MRPLHILWFLALVLPAQPAAAEGDGSHDISYLWTPDRRGAEAYRELVAEVLGPEVARDLQIVIGGTGNFGVVYDRAGTDTAGAQRVAGVHHRLLKQAFGGADLLAGALPDRGDSRLLDVRYGETGDLDTCRRRFGEVAAALGVEVERDLVILRIDEGRYDLVFRLSGTPGEADELAVAHTAALGSAEVSATAVRVDPGAAAVWDASSGGGESESEAEAESAALDLTSTDIDLRNAINDHIQALRGSGSIAANERTAWVVVDLDADETLAAINADTPLQCASMVKPLVALAFFHEVDRGRFVYGNKSRAKMERMIQFSDNDATNWVIDQVGGSAAVQRILETHYGELLPQISIVERIPAGGRTYRNKASAADYARFLRAVWRRELPSSDELLRLMNLPNGDRIYREVPEIPVGTHVYDKTGTTAMLCGDMGILVARDTSGDRVPYAVIGIIEKQSRPASFRTWIAQRGDVIRAVSGLVYRRLGETHSLQ